METDRRVPFPGLDRTDFRFDGNDEMEAHPDMAYDPPALGASAPVLSKQTFVRFSDLIESRLGIKMPPVKRVMLQSRLQKRLRRLPLTSFEAYFDYVTQSNGTGEWIHLVDAVTTNKTDFFREPRHFDFLTQSALPALFNTTPPVVNGGGLRVWSAGCASGEEPYTLAMVLCEVAARYPDFRFSILATDVSNQVLEQAHRAIYPHERVAPVPMGLRKRYLLRSRDPKNHIVRIAPEIRARVRFQRLNFMDDDFDIPHPMHVIFCRNVIIYFERSLQETILQRLCRHLIPGGYLFLGHSETLTNMHLPVTPVAPTVYQRTP